jgi:hypothetical protein
MTHKKDCKILVRDLIVQTHEVNITVSDVSRGRPSYSGAQLSRLGETFATLVIQRETKTLSCVFAK